MNALAVALVMLPTLGVGLSMGLATGKAVESVARQPETPRSSPSALRPTISALPASVRMT